MVKSILNKKIVVSIISVLVLWLIGIIITPILTAKGWSLGQFMYFFYKPVCHQLSDRSFWLDGFTLAVCIRCFGFYLGGLFISLFYGPG